MKKTAIILVVLSLLICLLGCGDTDVEPNEDMQATNSSLSSIDNNVAACEIEYLFGSIADMETYINTGSTNIDDYQKQPSPSFDSFPSNKILSSYISIETLLGINEEQFSYSEASFQYTSDGKVTYKFYLDDILIVLAQTDADNIVQYLRASDTNMAMSNIIYPSYQEINTISNGYVLRQLEGDTSIVYNVRHGVKGIATFLIDNYAVTINGIFSSSQETISNDYQKFLTSSKTSVLAPYFAEDQQIVETALNNVKLQVTDNR